MTSVVSLPVGVGCREDPSPARAGWSRRAGIRAAARASCARQMQHPRSAATLDDVELATLVGTATPPRSKPSTTATTLRCSRSAATCSATARTARTRCSRPSSARIAALVRAGHRPPCAPGCSRSRATAASRCSRRGGTSRCRPSEPESGADDLAEHVRRRAELRELVADLGELPDDQRAALVLAELGDLSHPEIAAVIGCPPKKVKALVFQAREALVADRDARCIPCTQIRGSSRRRTATRCAAPRCAATCGSASPATPTVSRSTAASGSARCSRSRRRPA